MEGGIIAVIQNNTGSSDYSLHYPLQEIPERHS